MASSFLSFDNDLLSGGSFIIDMKTIVCTDLSGEGKASLENHLMSDDFGVEKHPYASLNIVDAIRGVGENYKIVAIIEIKGITKKSVLALKLTTKAPKLKLLLIEQSLELYTSLEISSRKLLIKQFTMTLSCQ